MDFFTISLALFCPIYYLIYIIFNYSYILTPLLVLFVYKFFINGEQNVPCPVSAARCVESSSEGEDEGDEGEVEGESEGEDENEVDESEYEEVLYFRAYVVRKYVRVNYVRRST
ncbi:hypothetical protein Glove_79g69 [Diversispora epigaea]|uniref:Uncharacterized protein n=1 Tax=Diversispora epigaea TaxID=1348612 RepID=A0A397J8D2_9GLOM|nr:hypothetical protein Glove_79g69 [Diversispora epigaea]